MKGEDEKQGQSNKVQIAVIVALTVYCLLLTAVVGWLAVKVQKHEIEILELQKKPNNEADEKQTIIDGTHDVHHDIQRREVLNTGNVNIMDLIKQGIRGPPGSPGRDGLPGHPGKDGRDAVNFQAIDLHVNNSIARTMRSEMEKVKTILKSVPVVTGSVYIRWGRTSCPSHSKLLMKGLAAGTNYNIQGGSADYICIADDPEYHPGASTPSQYSLLAGLEYEYPVGGVFKHKSLHDKNAPCSYCQTANRASHVMIPGRMSCPSEWTLEYIGSLMTAHPGHYRASYICVDENSEAIPGSNHDKDGARWYHVIANCNDGSGALGYCPPYKPDLPIACVVCSR